MAADHGVGPSTTTCERPAHILAPSHLVAVTVFTAGIAAWPYWQNGIAECWHVAAGRPARIIRMLPIVGPLVLAREAARRSYDPVVTLRFQFDFLVVGLLQLACLYVIGRGVADWISTTGTIHSWNSVFAIVRHLTYVWHTYALILIAGVSAIFMSDVQSELRHTDPHCEDSDVHLYAHLSINAVALVGAIVVFATLLSMHGNRLLLVLTVFVAAFAYVNGSRQRMGDNAPGVFQLRLWAHTTARHGGLVAGLILIACSVLLFNWMFDVNEGSEQGFQVGVFVEPRLLQPVARRGYSRVVEQICAEAVIPCRRNELPVVYPDLVSNDRVALMIDVPLVRPGRFAFALAKFRRAEATDDTISSDRVVRDVRPVCSTFKEATSESRPVPLFAATLLAPDGEPQTVFIGEPFVDGHTEIRCSFADTGPDVLESTFTRRRVSFSACCPSEGILPPDLNRTQSEYAIDLHNFLANSDIALFGGRVDRRAPFDQRIRILSSANSTEVRDSPTQRELTVQWTERGTAESRDFILIVTASLLGVALVCILEWLRPRIEKFGHHRPSRTLER